MKKTLIQREHNRNLIILKQYQEITNKSAIISKTDPNGTITFVNENFCRISGYTVEELVGNSHNIVRHPDTPRKLFEELWKTIKVKKRTMGRHYKKTVLKQVNLIM